MGTSSVEFLPAGQLLKGTGVLLEKAASPFKKKQTILSGDFYFVSRVYRKGNDERSEGQAASFSIPPNRFLVLTASTPSVGSIRLSGIRMLLLWRNFLLRGAGVMGEAGRSGLIMVGI